MSKMKFRICAIALVCCLLCTAQLPVTAQEIYLGSDDDLTGYILPDDNMQTYESAERSYHPAPYIGGYPQIFSITATQVTSLLASSLGGKSFTVNQLPSSATKIFCIGTLSHSLQDVPGIVGNLYECVLAGICYYDYSTMYDDYVYISVHTTGPDMGGLGNPFESSFLIADKLERDVTYYSYIKNRYPAGYVYGTLSLYYTST